ncbi:glycosyltransferase 87 family protein [Kibdelosporangium lantanae]|uniref:Glycosyltransferase 87 family protein n=1 Tax=Kibdelosporangium lantanae TaxID=1497396 RepID=A0ABW3MES0_9PSEU
MTPAVFLLYFLFRKDFRASVTVVVSTAVATVIGLVVNWSGSLAFFFGTGGPRTISATGFIGNQSIAGAFARWKLSDSEQHQLWIYGCVAAGVVTVFALLRAYRMADPVLAMSVTAAFGLLISPVSWGHHWVFMIPAFMGMVAVGVRRRHVGWLVAAVVVAAVAVYPPYLLTDEGGYLMTVPQQLAANGFCVVAFVLLGVYAVPEMAQRLGATRLTQLRRGNPPT